VGLVIHFSWFGEDDLELEIVAGRIVVVEQIFNHARASRVLVGQFICARQGGSVGSLPQPHSVQEEDAAIDRQPDSDQQPDEGHRHDDRGLAVASDLPLSVQRGSEFQTHIFTHLS
jgi:hypothetical protein